MCRLYEVGRLKDEDDQDQEEEEEEDLEDDDDEDGDDDDDDDGEDDSDDAESKDFFLFEKVLRWPLRHHKIIIIKNQISISLLLSHNDKVHLWH